MIEDYEHIYSHYEEMEKEGLNDMTDESLMLDIDIIEKEHEEEIKRIVAEKDAELTLKDAELISKDAEIARLKKQLQKQQEKGI